MSAAQSNTSFRLIGWLLAGFLSMGCLSTKTVLPAPRVGLNDPSTTGDEPICKTWAHHATGLIQQAILKESDQAQDQLYHLRVNASRYHWTENHLVLLVEISTLRDAPVGFSTIDTCRVIEVIDHPIFLIVIDPNRRQMLVREFLGQTGQREIHCLGTKRIQAIQPRRISSKKP